MQYSLLKKSNNQVQDPHGDGGTGGRLRKIEVQKKTADHIGEFFKCQWISPAWRIGAGCWLLTLLAVEDDDEETGRRLRMTREN